MSKDKQIIITDTENKSNNFEDKSNKQIEQMAKVIGDADQRCYEMDCDDCPLHDTELGLCKEKFNATELYNAGYRKASEVAREIFEEIEEITIEHDLFGRTVLIIGQGTLAELKKKYTEGGD